MNWSILKFLRVYLSKIQLELSSAKLEVLALLPRTGACGKTEKVQKQRKELFDWL